MHDILASIAEARIRQAMEKGEFKDLPGKGRPLLIDNSLTLIPAEERMAYIVMRNAGLVPDEVAVMQDLDSLRKAAAACPAGKEKKRLEKKLRETDVRYRIMLEKRRSRS